MQNKTTEISSTHATNARNSVMSTLGISRIILNEDSSVKTLSHVGSFLGISIEDKKSILDYDISDSIKNYFKAMLSLKDRVANDTKNSSQEEWICVFSSAHKKEPFADWDGLPHTGWKKEGDIIQTTGADGQECYVMSDQELIAPDDDFRIEYMARADVAPSDLSLVVAQKGSMWQQNVFRERPDRDGYCFAFGAVSNRVTELQRSLFMIAFTEDVLITPKHNHHCVAERVGGVLKFTVDGKVAWQVLDTIPVMGAGRGHVGFYAVGQHHKFWGLKVWTRPTCLTNDTRERQNLLQGTVLHCPSSTSEYLEVHYLGANAFVFKDVTEVVIARKRLEQGLREAEEKKILLTLASAAAHEMNQPLTVILGHVDLLMFGASPVDPKIMEQNLLDLKESTEQMAEIVRKIGNIQHFTTKAYPGNSEILDINASSSKEPRL